MAFAVRYLYTMNGHSYVPERVPDMMWYGMRIWLFLLFLGINVRGLCQRLSCPENLGLGREGTCSRT